MIKIDFVAGTHIEDAANHLWSKAPAEGEFNGIHLKAERGTSPADIVEQYERESEARHQAWISSPEGKAQIEEDEKARQEAQAQINASMRALPALDEEMDPDPGWYYGPPGSTAGGDAGLWTALDQPPPGIPTYRWAPIVRLR